MTDEDALAQNLAAWLPDEKLPNLSSSFDNLTVDDLNSLRDQLFEIESSLRRLI